MKKRAQVDPTLGIGTNEIGSPKKRGFGIFFIILIVIIVIVIGSILFFSLSNHNSGNLVTENESKIKNKSNLIIPVGDNIPDKLNDSFTICKNSCANLCQSIGGNFNGQSAMRESMIDVCSCNCGNVGNVFFNLTTGEKVIIVRNESLTPQVDKIELDYYKCISNLNTIPCPPEADSNGECVDATDCSNEYWKERQALVGNDYAKWTISKNINDVGMTCVVKGGNGIMVPNDKGTLNTYFKVERRDCYKEQISSSNL